jgi:hypothetical protein
MGVKAWPAREADSLTTICDPIVKALWEPRLLTILQASTTCYIDSFTFYFYVHVSEWVMTFLFNKIMPIRTPEVRISQMQPLRYPQCSH